MEPFKEWCKIVGNDEEGWTVEYEVVQGKVNRMSLDASTEDEAKFEAAGLTGIPEADITVEYS